MDRSIRAGWLPPPVDPKDAEIARLRAENATMRVAVRQVADLGSRCPCCGRIGNRYLSIHGTGCLWPSVAPFLYGPEERIPLDGMPVEGDARRELEIMRELVERAVGRSCRLDGPESAEWLDDARRALEMHGAVVDEPAVPPPDQQPDRGREEEDEI